MPCFVTLSRVPRLTNQRRATAGRIAQQQQEHGRRHVTQSSATNSQSNEEMERKTVDNQVRSSCLRHVLSGHVLATFFLFGSYAEYFAVLQSASLVVISGSVSFSQHVRTKCILLYIHILLRLYVNI